MLADELSRSYLQASYWSSSLIYEEMRKGTKITCHFGGEEEFDGGLLSMIED